MWRRSCFAFGAQTTRLSASGVLIAGLLDDVLDVELLAHAGIQFTNADFDFSAKFGERLDALQQFATELFLRRFGECSGLRDREFERFHHDDTIPHSLRKRAC